MAINIVKRFKLVSLRAAEYLKSAIRIIRE
jgi:hypothetical protein